MGDGRPDSAPRGRLGGPGYALVERARDTIRRHGLLAGGERVLVAVSGGPDSTCLLDVLVRLQGVLDLELEVAHVDHGLSADSERVAARVARHAAEAGFEVHLMRLGDLGGPNLQARARELRYGFFDMVVARTGATRVATGHTLDDRVETTLARLIHGAGTGGLAGLPPLEGARMRPLADVRRAETRAYCEERGLQFFDDPANTDVRFERAAVRALVVAPIETHWGDGGVRAIARSAERLREDAGALDALAERIAVEVSHPAESAVELDKKALLALPRALQRRVLELAVGRVRDRAAGIDEVLDHLGRAPDRAARFDLAAGTSVSVTSAHVRVEPGPLERPG